MRERRWWLRSPRGPTMGGPRRSHREPRRRRPPGRRPRRRAPPERPARSPRASDPCAGGRGSDGSARRGPRRTTPPAPRVRAGAGGSGIGSSAPCPPRPHRRRPAARPGTSRPLTLRVHTRTFTPTALIATRTGHGATMRRVKHAVRAVSLSVVLVCVAGTMAAGTALKYRCATGNYDGRQYRELCYSDIVPLLGTEQPGGG